MLSNEQQINISIHTFATRSDQPPAKKKTKVESTLCLVVVKSLSQDSFFAFAETRGRIADSQPVAGLQTPNPWQDCRLPTRGRIADSQPVAGLQAPNPWQDCRLPTRGRIADSEQRILMQFI